MYIHLLLILSLNIRTWKREKVGYEFSKETWNAQTKPE